MNLGYGRQTINQDDIDAVVEVLNSDWLTQGPFVEQFENALGEKVGGDYVCAVSSGTAALHLAGVALDWKEGDIVITTPITFLATANAIRYSGARPDFVDIDSSTYSLDPNCLEDKIKKYRKKGINVTACIGVDFAGQPAGWNELREIANKYEIHLINDCCHALGAAYKGNEKYASKYADIVTYSFHPVKQITTGEGGAIVSNDAMIGERVKRLRGHGIELRHDQSPHERGSWYYEMVELGFNYRITDIQCALGLTQLKKLDSFVKRRREIARRYDEALSGDCRFILPLVANENNHAYHLYPLQINFDDINASKKEIFERLARHGIRLQVHYIPIYKHPYYRNLGFQGMELENAENFYRRVVSLPIYPTLREIEQEHVINTLLKECN